MLRLQRSRNRMEKILIIEDEEHLRDNLGFLLTDEGYHVVTAEDGEEGIQCLVQEPFDLVITDIMMGNVSGFAVLEYVVTHRLDALVIFITGFASTESAIAALRQGVYDYIAKPFDIDMLLIVVKRALEKLRLQREIKTHIQELEQRVADRTKELEETNSRLKRALEELRATQERLIEQRVADRTKELEETNSRLNRSLEELRTRRNRRGTNS
jgi:DNA-binding NtrC family response regulator